MRSRIRSRSGVRIARRLPLRRDAIKALHAPRHTEETKLASDRLAYEELLLLQVALAERRAAAPEAEALGRPGELLERYRASLPFTLTTGQKRSVRDIDRDLARRQPMRRLLLGDVGSGKTVVAVHAMLRAAERGAQAALLAPTEVLVQQHAATVRGLIEPLGLELAVVTGDIPAAERRARLQRIASGDAALVVGTHALLERSVEFDRLRVIVVDEQHRFGVEQRAALSEGHGAHALHMTATPIPRSLALSLYGDLDLTELRELPAGRQPIITRQVRGREARGLPPLARQGVARARPSGLRRVRARRGLRDRAGARRRGAARRARRGAGAAQRGSRPRAPEGGRARGHDARLRCRRGARARRHDGDRGRHRRPERDGDGDRGRRSLRPLAAASAARARGAGQRRSRTASCSSRPSPASSGSGASPRSASTSSGFDLAELDLRMRGEGELAGLRQSGATDLRHASLARHRRLVARSRADARFLARAGPFDPVLAQAARERFGELVERIGRS